MLKKYVDLVVKSRLILTSTGRTMLKLPVWAAALLVLFGSNGIKLLVIAALAIVGLGMHVTVEKG